MATKPDNQKSLWDKEIESPELEAAIELIESHKLPKDEARELREARDTVRRVVETYELTDGQRLRCGRFIITGKARNGGGFEVPTWAKVTVGSIEEVGLTS